MTETDIFVVLSSEATERCHVCRLAFQRLRDHICDMSVVLTEKADMFLVFTL